LAPGVFAVMPDDALKKDDAATTAGFVIGERLFEWAHNSVNVPAAHQHLRALRGGET
jgi:hypothetical protein